MVIISFVNKNLNTFDNKDSIIHTFLGFDNVLNF